LSQWCSSGVFHHIVAYAEDVPLSLSKCCARSRAVKLSTITDIVNFPKLKIETFVTLLYGCSAEQEIPHLLWNSG
jgi:hypothetical protein